MDVQCCVSPADSQSVSTNQPLDTTCPLPNNLQVYPNQVGGHGMFGNKGRILHSVTLRAVYKPVQKYPKGPHEVDFYRLIFNPDCEDSVILNLRPFIPTYRGLYHHPSTKALYLCLDDVLHKMKYPSICDIKMGRYTYTPDAPAEKIAVEMSKYKWQAELGFLISAMRVFYPLAGRHPLYIDRTFGRSLDPSTVYDYGIRVFLGPDLNRSRCLARSFVARLSDLRQWFEKQHTLSFYASSLLLAYESRNVELNNGSSSLSDTDEYHESEDYVIVYIIDFARWRPLDAASSVTDENFLYGLRNVTELFERASSETRSLQLPTQQLFTHKSADPIS